MWSNRHLQLLFHLCECMECILKYVLISLKSYMYLRELHINESTEQYSTTIPNTFLSLYLLTIDWILYLHNVTQSLK